MFQYVGVFIPIITVVIIALVIALIAFLGNTAKRQQNSQKQIAWDEGIQWCIRVHALENSKTPVTPTEMPQTRADAWREGYLAVLDLNSLPLSDTDRDELHHNPYIAKDSSQAIANAAIASSMAVSSSINNINNRQ